MGKVKTNAMRILDKNEINYQIYSYDPTEGVDGKTVAAKIGKDPKQVFKTLVTEGSSKNNYVFIIPVEKELDLKKAAQVTNEKKVEMVPVKDIQKLTGYIRGGCSPIGMKKLFPTFLDESATQFESIVVSGGKIGIQIEIPVKSLQQMTNATFHPLVK